MNALYYAKTLKIFSILIICKIAFLGMVILSCDREPELLVSKWFPIKEASVESVRERSASSALPPLYFLHVWFARRPLATSRAAVLGSLLPSGIRREEFLRLLGIPAGSDVAKAEEEVAKAKAAGIRLESNPFYWKRAYKHTPSSAELSSIYETFKEFWGVERPLVVDPMAGGGSIPFEAMRLGLPVVAGDLNPVAFVCLKGTLEYPARFGKRLLPAVEKFCKEIHEAAKAELEEFFPKQPGEKVYAYLWARTIKCPSCGLIIPLSPNWWIFKSKLDEESVGARLIFSEDAVECRFEIIKNPVKHNVEPDKGTVKRSYVECPRCHIVINEEEVRRRARDGEVGHQLYAVCTKTKFGSNHNKWHYRLPMDTELAAFKKAGERLLRKLEEYRQKNLFPEELVPDGFVTRQPKNYGLDYWHKFFNPRQLLTHLTYLEKFQQAKEKLFADKKHDSEEWEFAKTIVTYGAIIFDTCVDYNCLISLWHSTRNKVAHMMSLQAFPFKWSYAEWDHSQMLWSWALSKVLDALKEIIELLPYDPPPKPTVYCGTATAIPLEDKSVPCVVVDPPYAENVFYGESSDFFYVWLKRLLGDVFPKEFSPALTDKEEEAVANPARFKGMGRGSKALAQEDYRTKMQSAFLEIKRILRDDGVLTVMFTHRTAEAWSSLATALMNAGFTFVSSWPVRTEPPDKFAKRDKGVLKVTVILTCRKRAKNRPGIWEHIVDELRQVARERIEEFSKLGISGPDLKVSAYAPVLGRFADYYPVKTATGKSIGAERALELVTEVLNERFLKEVGIESVDRESAAYINLLSEFPSGEAEYEEARLSTVFGGLVTLDSLDVKGDAKLVEKKGSKVKLLSASERMSRGIIDPYNQKTLRSGIDNVHAAILLYERGGRPQVDRLIRDRNLDLAGSSFHALARAYAAYAAQSSDERLRKEGKIGEAMLMALGITTERARKAGDCLTDYL